MEKKEIRALEIIRTVHRIYGDRIAVACSFGKDSMVVLHLCLRICPRFPVFFVKTKFMPKETFTFKDKVVERWNLNFKEYFSPINVDYSLHLTNPDECCRILKVEPTKEAVKDLDAWITGLRTTEGETRKEFMEIQHTEGGLVKINPILSWTEGDVWRYIAKYNIPIHPWYKKGYRSLGCAPCTTITGEEESERAGRWRGTQKQGGECGIHTQPLKACSVKNAKFIKEKKDNKE